jgi:nucleotide-binding universal stress UspA family protein
MLLLLINGSFMTVARESSMSKPPILVPVDFSPCSTAALLLASELAVCLQAPLLVLHVVHDSSAWPEYYRKLRKKKQTHHMKDLAEESLNQFLRQTVKAHPDHPGLAKADRLLVSGLPVQRILEVAGKTEARMIVLGSKGLTGFSHLLIGSTAAQIVQLATVPVTVIKGDQP